MQAVETNTPQPNATRKAKTMTYTSAAEDAAAIRKALKLKGWNSRQISVKSDTYSMGSSVDVTIKAAGISKKEVEAIAIRFDDVRRDEHGDILSGGNRFVTVRFDHDLLAERAKKFRPIIDATPSGDSSSTYVIAAGRKFCILRPERWRVTLFERGEGGETFHCMGEDAAAEQLAQIDLESGTDEPAAPAVAKVARVHERDEDCVVDPRTGCCNECGVEAGDPCENCGGRSFHRPGCPTIFSTDESPAKETWDALHSFLDLDPDGPDPLEAYAQTGASTSSTALIIPEINPESCHSAAQIGKGQEVDCACEACTDRQPGAHEEPVDLFTIWVGGVYLGQIRAQSPQAARDTFSASYGDYYSPETLVVLRVAVQSK